MSGSTSPRRATKRDLQHAVYFSDRYPMGIGRRDGFAIVAITLARLGMAALGNSVQIDLGNGHSLNCTVQPIPTTTTNPETP